MKHVRVGLLSFLVCVLGAAIVWGIVTGAQKKDRQKPNIIIIMADALRPDHLGCYGYGRNTSPAIDAFAKTATRYASCFASGTWTMTSNYSILTSLYPDRHGVYEWEHVLSASVPTLFSELQARGYTIGVFGNHPLWLANLKQSSGKHITEYRFVKYSDELTRAAIQWLKRIQSPFCLYVYFGDTHRPYEPPPPYDTLFAYGKNAHLPIQKVGADYEGGWDYIPNIIVRGGIDNPSYYIAQYDGEIRNMDTYVGNVMQALREKRIFDSSLMLFTADHGESLGEHHLYFNHIYTLFNEIIKVPLIIKYPFQSKPAVVETAVSLVDITPTVLRTTGAILRSGFEGIPLSEAESSGRALFSYGTKGAQSVIKDQWKLIMYRQECFKELPFVPLFFAEYPRETVQLFDRFADPQEKMNVAHANQDVVFELLSIMNLHRGRADTTSSGVSVFPLDDDLKEKVKSLGYAQ